MLPETQGSCEEIEMPNGTSARKRKRRKNRMQVSLTTKQTHKMAGNHSGHMVSEFESSFQSCLAALTNEDHFNVHDLEEIKAGVEQTVAKFLEMAKQMECFFLQKRLLLSAQKPEQIVKEDIADLKSELNRKELLIQKHYDKIQFWQSLLSGLQGPGPRPPHLGTHEALLPPPPPHLQQPPPQTQPQPQPHQISNMPHVNPAMMPNTALSGPMPMMQQVSQPMQQVVPQVVPPPMQSMPQGQLYGPPPPQMAGGMVQHPGMHTSGLQGPLAYLEKTTSNIGMPEPR